MAKVLVLGAASWNRMVHVDQLPQGASATIFKARETEGAGSTGVGKAMVLAALGHDVTLHCALGRDVAADGIVSACHARGINVVVDWQDTPTPRHLNIMDKDGGRYSIFVENGSEAPDLDEHRLTSLISTADAIFLSLCHSSRKALHLLDTYRHDILLDLHDYDGKNPWYDDFIARADVVQVSDVALPDPESVVQRLLVGRARQVVVTKGGNGAEIHTATGGVPVPICPATLRDSNGAGDAFSCALWHDQCNGREPQLAGRFAAAAAALAIESDALFPADADADAITGRAGLN